MIIVAVRAIGRIVLSVSSSGIIFWLLIGGRTAYSKFQILILYHENGTHNIKQGDVLADIEKNCSDYLG